jgi:hypothetical protein
MKNNNYELSFDRERHGSLYDRGAADSYYNRPMHPHWYPEGTYNGLRVENLDGQQVAEYKLGYMYNEKHGDKKVW